MTSDQTNIQRICVGVLSDTHGLLRSETIKALEKVDFIIHAGDIGERDILNQLRAIAPTTAVRGNMDGGSWLNALNKTELVEIGAVSFYILHDINELDLNPSAAGISIVVSGHTHRPALDRFDGILYLNPGSAGPRRYSLPATLALVWITGTQIQVSHITLEK